MLILIKLCRGFMIMVFLLEQINGSHHILRRPGTKTKLYFQPAKSDKAKPYQLKQAFKAIDLLNL